MTQSDTGYPQRNALTAPHCRALTAQISRGAPRRKEPCRGAEGVMMKSFVIAASLLLFLSGTRTQEGFDLADALPGPEPTKAKEPTKAPQKPKPDDGFSLEDAIPSDPKPTKKPSVPSGGGGGGGGGGSFSDNDLANTLDDGYQPDKTGGHAADSNYDTAGGDGPSPETGSGQIAGIISAIGVALLGAASSYFAYQKKKLCFKLQGGTDPERGKGHAGTQSEPQVLSNLLQSN